jgi:hypothetical protein
MRLSAIMVLVGLLLLPDVNIAQAAARNTTKLSIVSGKLVHGVARITIKYDCFPNGYGPYSSFGDVRVGQVNGAGGDTFFHPRCNDKMHTMTISVIDRNRPPFRRRDAAVAVYVCGFDCKFISREIRLR